MHIQTPNPPVCQVIPVKLPKKYAHLKPAFIAYSPIGGARVAVAGDYINALISYYRGNHQ